MCAVSKAAVMLKPGEIETREIDIPEVGKEDILMKVDLCGICGTDIHLNKGHMEVRFPVIPGHEFAGKIVEMGENARIEDSKGELIKEGDSITVVPGMVCGKCWYCRNIPVRPNICTNRKVYGYLNCETFPYLQGGWSEYVYVVSKAWIYKLPKDLPIELGALAEPLSVAIRAIERAFSPGIPFAREGFGMCKNIAIQGVGPIGLLVVATAKTMGANMIIALDVNEERLRAAKKFGATHTINLTDKSKDERIKKVKELTFGNVGVDAVIECTGVPTSIPEGLEMLRKGGKYIEVGHFADAGTIPINPHLICSKDLDIHGSWVYPPNQFETAISLLHKKNKEIPLMDLFTHKFSIEQASDGLEVAASGKALKVIIKP
jgi:L-iditol 2-dehydrogenase